MSAFKLNLLKVANSLDQFLEDNVVIAAIQQLKELQLEPEKIVRPRRDSNP